MYFREPSCLPSLSLSWHQPSGDSCIDVRRNKTVSLGTAIFLSALILGAVALYGPDDGPLGLGPVRESFCRFRAHIVHSGALIILALAVDQIDFKGRFIGYTYCEVAPQPNPDCK